MLILIQKMMIKLLFTQIFFQEINRNYYLDYKFQIIFSLPFDELNYPKFYPSEKISFQYIKNLFVNNQFTIVQSIYNFLIQNYNSKYQLNPGINIINNQISQKLDLKGGRKRKFIYYSRDMNNTQLIISSLSSICFEDFFRI
jgi:hypothetical protein